MFIVAASGRIARVYLGSYEDAHDVAEWVKNNGGTAEVIDTLDADKIVRVTNPGDGPTVDLVKFDYLILDKGVFFTEPESAYKGDPWDGVDALPPMELRFKHGCALIRDLMCVAAHRL